MLLDDTIFAVSSPGGTGTGVRGIVRLSGPHAHALTCAVTDLTPHAALRAGHHSHVSLRLLPDNRLASVLIFREPKSFTGQDIAELHVPNSPALLQALLDDIAAAAVELGIAARPAEPGEFSARAFFNGKIDLTEAEGIAATISAANQTQLRAAASLREGDLHKWTARITDQLADLLALVEAGIDFADEEDIHFVERAQLESSLHQLAVSFHNQLAASIRMDRLSNPPAVVFIGKPNVGKSSLINALAGRARSIVSPIAGTTRDMLAVSMRTSWGEVRLVDVPGEEPASDELRQKMMAARETALLDADLIVEVVADDRNSQSAGDDADFAAQRVTVRNKADLLSDDETTAWKQNTKGEDWRLVSAKTDRNIPALREALARRVTSQENAEAHRLALNHRHRAILHETNLALRGAAALVRDGTGEKNPELLASELRRALNLLGQVTGAISADEVLGRVFSQFCIGK